MFSIDSARQADACRFCWMCRHICPVGGATGNEGWTPRARGLMMSMIERGTEYDGDIAESMYHCTLCDACANDCATGYKPSEFIREARTVAVAENIAPKAILKSIDAIAETGNIFGKKVDTAAFGELPEKADVLLYVGQSAAVNPGTALAVAKLLKAAGVNFTVLKDEAPSGAYMSELMGFTGDVQAMAAKLAKDIVATDATKIVVLNPMDACILRDQYAEWDLLGGIEIITATAYIAALLATGALKVKAAGLSAALQEPVKLTRGLDEIAPAKALLAAAGVELKELFLNGKMSRCVGTVVLDEYDAVTVKNMVRVRCEDAVRLDIDTIITASPDDYYIMSKYATNGVKILDIYQILAENC